MKIKLYTSVKSAKVYDYYSHSREFATFITLENLSFLYYPNMQPCFEANAYLIELSKKGLSNFNGGTLKTYATNISHLVKYKYLLKSNTKFTELDDNHIYDFITTLKNRGISDSHVITIAKQSFEFLFFVAKLYNKTNLIGTGNKFQIRLRKTRSRQQISHSSFDFSYTHLALPRPSHSNPIMPVSLTNIKKLRNFVIENCKGDLKFRNLCLLDLLELTGARRTEIINLTIKHLKEATISGVKDSLPLLKFETLKKRQANNLRYIPIPQNLLNNLLRYMRYYRNPIIKKYGIQEHGMLFISHRSGKPLGSDTLTTYLNSWSKLADIEPAVHAHQFRHRYITEKFKALIIQHDINTPDSFSKLLLSHEKLKQQVLQWTGHSNINSLDPYIHLATLEMTNLNQSLKNINLVITETYIKTLIADLMKEYDLGNISTDELVAELNRISTNKH